MDWSLLVAKVLHPTQVAIIEALSYFEKPISSQQLTRSFDDGTVLSSTAYHVRALANHGIIEKVGDRKVRGAVENFYALIKS